MSDHPQDVCGLCGHTPVGEFLVAGLHTQVCGRCAVAAAKMVAEEEARPRRVLSINWLPKNHVPMSTHLTPKKGEAQ